jgi:pimeloyl-ACP methyl ester carboxylesterase
MIFRRFMAVAGIMLSLPVCLLGAMALFIPVTFSGAAYLIGALLIVAGAMTAPWRQARFRGITRAGLTLIILVACTRVIVAARGTTTTLITLPSRQNTRWLARIVHERDISLFGVQAAYLTATAISPREHDGLIPTLQAAYRAMEEAGESTSSPFLNTYLGCQDSSAFDAVIIEPASGGPARAAVVFLHGFGGNFAVQGWLVAQAARKVGALTVCPSVGWRGDWWSEEGQRTIRNTLDYVHGRGVKRIYLAGLSNGAVGSCRLAPRLRSELSGLILISGADPRAPDAGLSVLALQGNADERMPAALAIQLTRQLGARGTYREFDGDHLLLAKRASEVQEALVAWLIQQEKADRVQRLE